MSDETKLEIKTGLWIYGGMTYVGDGQFRHRWAELPHANDGEPLGLMRWLHFKVILAKGAQPGSVYTVQFTGGDGGHDYSIYTKGEREPKYVGYWKHNEDRAAIIANHRATLQQKEARNHAARDMRDSDPVMNALATLQHAYWSLKSSQARSAFLTLIVGYVLHGKEED